MVLGGGNVAMDVARTAVRLGAQVSHMACLEAEDKMPAHDWEVEAAEDEGITILSSPLLSSAFVSNGDGRVGGLECARRGLLCL